MNALVRMQKQSVAALIQFCATELLLCYLAAQLRCCVAELLLCCASVSSRCKQAMCWREKIITLIFHIVTTWPISTKLRLCYKNGLSNLPRDIFCRTTFCRSTMWSPDAPHVLGGDGKKFKVIYF